MTFNILDQICKYKQHHNWVLHMTMSNRSHMKETMQTPSIVPPTYFKVPQKRLTKGRKELGVTKHKSVKRRSSVLKLQKGELNCGHDKNNNSHQRK